MSDEEFDLWATTHAAALEALNNVVEKLQAENAALREIVAAVATFNNDTVATWGDSGPLYCVFDCPLEDGQHAPDCPVTKARALLGA